MLAIDTEKRQIKLSMKQLIPTSIDEYIAEHKIGDEVSGRVVELSGNRTIVELGEGIRANCSAASCATLRPPLPLPPHQAEPSTSPRFRPY